MASTHRLRFKGLESTDSCVEHVVKLAYGRNSCDLFRAIIWIPLLERLYARLTMRVLEIIL